MECWLEEDRLSDLATSSYWNDEENEKTKEWHILDGDFRKMEEYVSRMRFPEALRGCVRALKNKSGRDFGGTGIDLAAGSLWAVPHLFKLGRIERLYCLEFSKHRLLKIGPAVLEHYGVPPDKVVLVFGNFYDLHLPDASLDFVLLASAFHHAYEPERLLAEISRVLKPEGCVFIIGEPMASRYKAYARHWAKYALARILPRAAQVRIFGHPLERSPFWPDQANIFPVDRVLGDHFYTPSRYRQMFEGQGFHPRGCTDRSVGMRSFVLVKSR